MTAADQPVFDPYGKYALEAALRREPGDAGLRARYREVLERINRTTLGLNTIVIPELMNPLFPLRQLRSRQFRSDIRPGGILDPPAQPPGRHPRSGRLCRLRCGVFGASLSAGGDRVRRAGRREFQGVEPQYRALSANFSAQRRGLEQAGDVGGERP